MPINELKVVVENINDSRDPHNFCPGKLNAVWW